MKKLGVCFMSFIPPDHPELYAFFQKLDRSNFIDNEYKQLAEYDTPLPIGFEQTISQPTLVLQMTETLNLNKESRVLEIGTGSGYQTAFLAEFAKEVYTVERIAALSRKAEERLKLLGYGNIHFSVDNGSNGWAEFAPYDRIIVTAAAREVPDPLLEQLQPGGKLLIPVGEKGCQNLLLIEKDTTGSTETTILEKVIFVELKGDYGWENGPSFSPSP
jgi:protein-L-isoaspartate(D-aspartate) O-methyltransferase